MKKQFICLLSTLSIFTLIGCNKNTEEYQLTTKDSIKYLLYNGVDKLAMVVGYDEKLGEEVTIPSSVNGYTVNAIRRDSFVASSISKITLPESVNYIGDLAFGECSNLKEISFPKNLFYLGDGAFYKCALLNNVDLSNTSIESIGSLCFSNCYSLTNINLGSVGTISSGAFSYCTSLTEINLPDSLLSIKDYAFNSCDLDKIFIPANVTYIGEGVFTNNNDNFKILMGASEVPIYFSSNFNCYYPYALGTNRNTKTSDVFIKVDNINYAINSYQSNDPSASLIYPNEDGIFSLNVQDTVAFQGSKTAKITNIADHAFIGDNVIQTLDLTNASNLKTIGEYAFASSSLQSVSFISNIEKLEAYSFANCEKLASIDLSAANTLNIGGGAFYYDYNLTSATLPNSGSTTLGAGAFYKCRKLSTLTNLDKISELNLKGYTFAECYNLGKAENSAFLFSANIKTLYPTDFLDWGTTQNQYIKISKDAYNKDQHGEVYLTANEGTIKLEKVDDTHYKNNLYFSNAIITLEPQD